MTYGRRWGYPRRSLGAFVELGARDAEFKAVIEGAVTRLKSFGAQILAVGAMFNAAKGILMGYGKEAVGMSNTFERSMAKIEGLVGINHDVVKGWTSELLTLGPRLGKSPQELAEALFFITSAGLRGEKAIDALTMSARAASAGLGATVVVADAVTSAVNAYAKTGLTAAQATDVLVAAVREGKVSADSLAPSIGRVLPIASAMGVSFADVAGAIAAMSRTGLAAEEATVALQAMLTTLAKPGTQASEGLAKVGMSMKQLREVATGPGGVVKAFRMLDAAFKDDIEAFEKVVPNVRAVRGALNLLSQDAATVDSVMAGVRNSLGSTERAAAVMGRTMAANFNRAIQASNALLTRIGMDIAQVVAPAFGIFASALRAVAGAWQQLNPATRTAIILGGMVITTLVPALATLSFFGSMVARGAAMALAPLALLTAAFIGLGKAVGGIGKGAKPQMLGMGPTREELGQTDKGLMAQTFDTVADAAGKTWERVSTLGSVAWEKVGAAGKVAWEKISSAAASAWQVIRDSSAGQTLISLTSNAVTLSVAMVAIGVGARITAMAIIGVAGAAALARSAFVTLTGLSAAWGIMTSGVNALRGAITAVGVVTTAVRTATVAAWAGTMVAVNTVKAAYVTTAGVIAGIKVAAATAWAAGTVGAWGTFAAVKGVRLAMVGLIVGMRYAALVTIVSWVGASVAVTACHLTMLGAIFAVKGAMMALAAAHKVWDAIGVAILVVNAKVLAFTAAIQAAIAIFKTVGAIAGLKALAGVLLGPIFLAWSLFFVFRQIQELSSGWSKMKGAITGAIGGAVDAAKTGLPLIWESIRSGSISAWQAFSTAAVAAFQSVRDTAMQAWEPVTNAIKDNRWGDAMAIAVAAINLEWTKLRGFLEETWIGFKAWFLSNAIDLAISASNAFAQIESAWVKMSLAMQSAWQKYVVGPLEKGKATALKLEPAHGRWARMAGEKVRGWMFGSDEELAEKEKEVDVKKEADQKIEQTTAGKDIEDRRLKREKALLGMKPPSKDWVTGPGREDLRWQEAIDAVAKAKADFEQTIWERRASSFSKKSAGFIGPLMEEGSIGSKMDEVKKGADAAATGAQKMQSIGTFSAAAAIEMAPKSLDQEQLTELKSLVKNTAKTNEKLDAFSIVN